MRLVVMLAAAAPLLAGIAAHLPANTPARTGTIEGRVLLAEGPVLRTAERYPTVGGATARDRPPIPVVVHLEGPGDAGGSSAPNRITQRDTTFVPSLVVVPAGAEVHFPNDDPFFHNVFSYSRARRFDLGRYPRGESKSVRFDRAGYVKVFCEIHEWMRSAVLVVDNPHYAIVGEDGRFTLEGVPEGEHTLVVTHFDRGASTHPVRVRAGETVRVQIEVDRE